MIGKSKIEGLYGIGFCLYEVFRKGKFINIKQKVVRSWERRMEFVQSKRMCVYFQYNELLIKISND